MRRVRYSVAMSLDGYIATEDGGYDWIVEDPTIDMEARFKSVDAALVGRRTYDIMKRGPKVELPGVDVYIASRTLRPEDEPGVTVVADAEATLLSLRDRPGGEIWIMGGGELFRGLLGAGLVDEVECAVIPILLGGGIPLLPPPSKSTRLELTESHVYPSGIVMLTYAVSRSSN
ncbi:MAG TPA: dihydrofolate reductase family protein [Isosphaeraceae bacterium]|jgi:dihydrofolate reductase